MSELNATEKQLVRVASFEASWLAGNAIAEATRMKKLDLFSQILSNFQSLDESIQGHGTLLDASKKGIFSLRFRIHIQCLSLKTPNV